MNERIKITKPEYIKTKLENTSNSRKGWQIINELLNEKSKTTQIQQLNAGDKTITWYKNIADTFNEYFSTIGHNLSKNILNNDPLTFVIPVDKFNFRNISCAELLKALNGMK